MKILTLWQPWASLIAHEAKLYETRCWGTNYRGLIAIHAAKRPTNAFEITDISDDLYLKQGTMHTPERERLFPTLDQAMNDQLPLGAIVAVCELTECLYMVGKDGDPPPHNHQDTILISELAPLDLVVGLWQPGRYAWQFKNVLKLPEPIPWKGCQGLRDLPKEAIDLIHQQGFSGGQS